MTKKIFLTSAVAMCFVLPAFAENFPGDGNMLENKTYDEAATYTNMGVYEGTVSANAYYDDIVYNIAAGNYLAAGSEATNGTQCPAGSWCPGISNINYSANTNQGLNSCPQDYSNSVAGASANTDCYRTCSTDDVAHSATVSGQMYYDGTSGDGVNACEPATCVSGWHKKNGLNLTTAVGTGEGASRAYVNASGNFFENGASNGASFYGLSTSDHNSFAVNYGNNGIIHGHGRCSTQSGQGAWNWNNKIAQTPTTFSSLTDETGQEGARYCYCNVTGYTPSGGTMQSLSSPWVFESDNGGASGCASNCANYCALDMHNAGSSNLAFRGALLGSVGASPASCEANTINITWNDASAEDIAATGAATTVYEGDIKTPLKAVMKPGKTFVGWKFVKPAAQIQISDCSEIKDQQTCNDSVEIYNLTCRWNTKYGFCAYNPGGAND